MTYKILSEQNKYLYGQLEHCTLMMGLALLEGKTDNYNNFLSARSDINEKIEINLQLIEDIWSAPVIPRPAKKMSFYKRTANELKVIATYKEKPDIGVSGIAYLLNLGSDFVEYTINNYITKKYGAA